MHDIAQTYLLTWILSAQLFCLVNSSLDERMHSLRTSL